MIRERIYNGNKDKDVMINIYLSDPEKYRNQRDILNKDKDIERYIREMLSDLETLKEYRGQLAKRYMELETMQYHHRVKLLREPNYHDNKKYYFVTTYKIYQDGTEQVIENTKYPGTKRKEAIEHYNTICKDHPSWEQVKEIEKRHWEK